MSVTTPEDLARKLASDGVACTDADLASRLLTDLRHAQAMGSPSSPEPLEVFARAGGVAALAAAMKANTPVAADWPEGMCPASGVDLAEVREDPNPDPTNPNPNAHPNQVQKEGCGVLNNLAASALAGGVATSSALREVSLLPLLVSTVTPHPHPHPHPSPSLSPSPRPSPSPSPKPNPNPNPSPGPSPNPNP